MIKLGHITGRLLAVCGIAFVLGVVVMIAVRFVAYKPKTVHYHANFALYINGQRDEFKGPGYYEEVTACMDNNSNDPKVRVHMHNNVNSTVHVHDNGATWGQFFANLGYTLSDTLVQTNNGTYISGVDGAQLTFLLNGKKVETIANKVIGDDDVMLISYGKEDQAALQKQYDGIPRDADTYDHGHDPAGCAGSKPLTFGERLKIAVGFNE